MNDVYSPHTGEHIITDNPAPWMGRAGVDAPSYDPVTQGCFWRGTAWEVVEAQDDPGPVPASATPAQEQIDAQRQQAYQAESDPLFFKWQRGQATEQEWLDKIAEIKQRYPDVQENT